MKKTILLERKYLLSNKTKSEEKKQSLYFSAKLLNQFGILVDHPEMITEEHVELVSKFYGVYIPESFYKNPQDTRYYTTTELLIEQLVSYWQVEINGVTNSNREVYDRVEIFSKVLPDYKEGSDVTFREYKVVDEEAADAILSEVATNLATYTRKWSENEAAEFDWLYANKFYDMTTDVSSKDNNITMFDKYPIEFFAKSFDRKDIVKLSVAMIGEMKNFVYTDDQASKLRVAAKNCLKTTVSKKQAKYYNTIIKKIGLKTSKVSNIDNPERIATALIKQGKVVDAAAVFAKNGSMLSRNLTWLLSRANRKETSEILDMIKVTNPLVTIQFIQGLSNESDESRSFSFYKNGKVAHHKESEYETKWRKSRLSEGKKSLVKTIMLDKIYKYYSNFDGIGKVYIDEAFKKIALPLNTSADGAGIDTIPAGSRLKIDKSYIRTFAYWKDLFDVDASLLFIKDDGTTDTLSWGTYSAKPFGNSALSSGDDRSANGAEYMDIDLDEIEDLGWKYVVFQLNGFNGSFDRGTTYCGYQNKSDLNTTAWDPKNIAVKIKLPSAKSREYVGFALDIKNREMIVINQMQDSGNTVINSDASEYLKKYMDSEYLEQFNVYKIASLLGDIVSDPSDADVVFSNTYKSTTGQKVIRATDTEKIVALIS